MNNHNGWQLRYPGGSSRNMHRLHDGPGPAGLELAGPDHSYVWDWGVEFGHIISNPPDKYLLRRKPRKIILTHSHYDHIAGLPDLMEAGYLNGSCEILGTPQTIKILPIAFDDMFSHGEACYTDIARILERCRIIERPGVIELGEDVSMFNASAGHIPGAMYSSIRIKLPNGEYYVGFVAGDMCRHNQRVVHGTQFPDDLPDEYLPSAIWWLDLTNPRLDAFDWEAEAAKMADSTYDALQAGKIVAHFAFGNSRTQNLVLRLLERGVRPIYVGGVGVDIMRVYAEHSWCPQDQKIPRPLEGVRIIRDEAHFEELIARGGPLCMVTTSGMGDHGYAASCVRNGLENPKWVLGANSWVDSRSPMGKILRAMERHDTRVFLNDSDSGRSYSMTMRAQIIESHLSSHGTLGDWVWMMHRLVERRREAFGRNKEKLDMIALTHGTQKAKALAATVLRPFARQIHFGNIGAMFDVAPSDR